MRETGVTSNTTAPIRCDLIGSDVCPEPSSDVLEQASAEASYGVASIWGKHGNPFLEDERNRP